MQNINKALRILVVVGLGALLVGSLGKVAFKNLSNGSTTFLAGAALAGSAALSYLLSNNEYSGDVLRCAKKGFIPSISLILSISILAGVVGGLAAHALAKGGSAIVSRVR